MANLAFRAEHNYRTGEFAVAYCGGCQFADHTGNLFTCNKMGGDRVEPDNVCDLFLANGVKETDVRSAYPPELTGEVKDSAKD